MSKDFDNIMKEILKQNKELHNVDNHLSKDIAELKRSLKNIENKTKSIDEKLTQIINIINNLTIFIGEDEDEESMENEEWTPYNETMFSDEDYPLDDEDDSDDSNTGLDDYHG